MRSTHSKARAGASRRSGRTAPARRRASEREVDIRTLSKNALVALVSTLQAREAPGDRAVRAPAGGRAIEGSAPPRAPARSLIVAESVRSGQTIEFPEGDVTVVGSVGSGAEIIAGGSIHVYGTLRGRALAGTAGDPEARIFCRSLQAELLSIDGKYRVAENFDGALWGRPVQARLEGAGMTLALID